WDEHSYGLALEAYRKALAADPNLPDHAEIEIRIAEALIHSQKWNEAVAALEAYVRKYRDTPFEARGQVWRGRLYTLIPHDGYRVGKKIYRGRDVPRSEGKEQLDYVYLTEEDSREVVAAFTRAHSLLERLRTQGEAKARAPWTRLEIEVDFDLANLYMAAN